MPRDKELERALEAIISNAQKVIEDAENIKALLSGPAKTYTLAEVRTALAALCAAGHQQDVKALIEAHGADKLTSLDPAEFTAIMTEAKSIVNE